MDSSSKAESSGLAVTLCVLSPLSPFASARRRRDDDRLFLELKKVRADPEALIEALKGSAGVLDLTAVRADTLRIDDRRYYKSFTSRTSRLRIGRRWLPLPGGSEQIRYLVRPFRWKQTCVLFRKGSDGAEKGAREILSPS
jgi:hypothetical protein